MGIPTCVNTILVECEEATSCQWSHTSKKILLNLNKRFSIFAFDIFELNANHLEKGHAQRMEAGVTTEIMIS